MDRSKQIPALLLLALSVTACGHATMVRKPNPYLSRAPLNQPSEIGTVAYRSRGSSATVDSSRFNALRMMSQACGGTYKQIGAPYYQYPAPHWWQPYSIPSRPQPSFTYIDFQCVVY